MEIIIGKTSGFCAGVRNAIIRTEEELDKKNKEIDCLGELVHNKQVIEKLQKKGLNIIEDIEQARDTVIIRAHGITKETYNRAQEKNIELIDLTCPKVLKIHKIIEEYLKNKYYIILVGVQNHPEVIGTMSFGENQITLVSKEDEIENAIKEIKNSKLEKVLLISQTTYNLQKFEKISEIIKNKISNEYEIEIKNTICPATRIRQEETEEISKKVDCMIIVGGKNSSNTKKLYDISLLNCKNVILVETAKEININSLKKYNRIGIMAGASTPNESVEEIVKLLKK